MAYGTELYDIDSILKRLGTRNVEGKNNPLNGTDMVNEAVSYALNQQKQGSQVLDPMARKYVVPQLLDSKAIYENAGNGALQAQMGLNENQIQDMAAAQANQYRQAAASAGFDLSDYGAGVSLEDARNNLATNDARAVIDLVQGKFALNSDQYFQSKYRELREQGYSNRVAKQAAGDMAMRYKADRMSYLNGMYNGYGVDNLVRTPLGDQIIRELALEDPTSANYYAQAQPGAREAYQETSATARQAMQNEGAMSRLIQEIAGRRDADIAKMYHQDALDKNKVMFNNEASLLQDQRVYEQKKAQEQDALWQKYITTGDIASRLGFDDKQIKAIQGSVLLNLPLPKTSDNDKMIGRLQNYYNSVSERIKDASTALGKLQESMIDAPEIEEQKQVLIADIAQYQKELEAIGGVLREQLGVGEEEAQEGDIAIQDYAPNDEASNIAAIANIIRYCTANNISDKQIEIMIEEWAKASGSPPSREKIAEYVKKAREKLGGGNK